MRLIRIQSAHVLKAKLSNSNKYLIIIETAPFPLPLHQCYSYQQLILGNGQEILLEASDTSR